MRMTRHGQNVLYDCSGRPFMAGSHLYVCIDECNSTNDKPLIDAS